MSEGRYQSIFRDDLFAGRTALITGGGTGIGRCTAHELASLGAKVVLAARRPEPLEKTREEIESAGGQVATAVMDIRDDDAVNETVAAIAAEHGPIHLLFNNAGGQFVSPAADIKPKGWRTVVDLILNATFIVSNAVYRHSMQEHGGAIVNMMADIHTGFPGMAHMAAARAGIANMAISLSYEWAAAGVRVNNVAPGTILSVGMKSYPPDIQERTAKEAYSLPSARLGTESEVSAAVTFLLSPAAAYITGETICIDGGSRFQKGRILYAGRHDNCPPFNAFHLREDFSGTPFEKVTK